MSLSNQENFFLDRDLTGPERNEQFVAEFFNGIMEGGEMLAETLHDRATHVYNSQGHTTNMAVIPEELLPFIQSDQTSMTADLRFTTAPEGVFNLHSLRLQPDDGAEVKLSFDGFATSVHVNEELKDFVLGDDLMKAALFSLLPYTRPDLKVESVARAIYAFSPFSTHHMEVIDGKLKYAYLKTETAEDSSRGTTIDVIIPHPSDKRVVFKASVTETLRDAIGGVEPKHAVEVSAGQAAIAFSEIIDGKIVDVNTPRLQHAYLVQTALESLLEKTWSD